MIFRIYTRSSFTVFGGVERMLLTFFSELQARGHELDIVSLQSSPFLFQIIPELQWLPIRKLILPASKDPRRLPQILKIIAGISELGIPHLIVEDLQNTGIPDLLLIIDSPEVVPDVRTACLKAGVHVPILYWDHGVIPFQFSRQNGLKRSIYYWFKRRVSLKAIRKADLGIAPSDFAVQFLRRAGIPVEKIYNPLSDYKGRLIGRPSSALFLFIGRLNDSVKNLSFLLHSLAKLHGTEWRLIIIGSGPDEGKLKRRARALGIAGRIEWAGFRGDPFANIEQVTCLLITSRAEALSLAALEALQRGIPVISSECGGLAEFIRPGVNGYLYPKDDEETFLSLLEKAITGELSFAGPEKIAGSIEEFRADRVLGRFLELVKELKEAAGRYR